MLERLRCLCLIFYQDYELLKPLFVPLTGDVDIVHVSGGNLFANLLDQIQDELNIISLALLRVNIPRRPFRRIIIAFSFLPAPLVAVWSHNDAVIPKEASERSGVTLASIACKMTKLSSDKYSS